MVLNKPIYEVRERFKQKKPKSRIQRMKRLPDVKIYFQFIIHQKQYLHVPEHNIWVENLLVLTKNRGREDLIFISSNPMRIVAAIASNFLTIPVPQYETNSTQDY